jgi:hypothetical protein
MNKKKIRKPDLDFVQVVERLKAAAGLKTDTELAAALGMSQSAFANRKQVGSLPYEKIVGFCLSENLNLSAIFAGETLTLEKPDPILLGIIMARLEELDSICETSDRTRRKYLAADHGRLAAILYPRLAPITQPDRRRTLLEALVREYVPMVRRMRDAGLELEDFWRSEMARSGTGASNMSD